jgi:pyridoxamine 5'-phosphate oxidase
MKGDDLTADADPLELLAAWRERAREAGLPDASAMSLATVGASGSPSARLVSLKRLDEGGLVFTTALWSRKVAELRANPRVAVTFYWQSLGRQARVEGRAEVVERELAEELFAERPRAHQLQAHVSRQGEEIESLEALQKKLEALDAELEEGPVPCPDDWGAVRIVPDRIEFWEEAADRMHRRTLFAAEAGGWRRSLLAP